MLTAAVRDLHRLHPGRFLTDVRSSCPELWEHNPHLTPLAEAARDVEELECHYPLIDRSNEEPLHCLHGFAEFLSRRLRVEVRPTEFRGDIHLSRAERSWKSTVHELAGRDLPFWIINAGGKFDFTIKWWDWRRYQEVVDHFRDRLLFVQVGEVGHYHPPLRHVVDLRGRTDLRQLVRLTYHAEGVLCGVTALMHLAAAVPTRPDRPPVRPAVVIAGGREPTHWEAYPHHQFLHTVGALSCCQKGGCWRARTRALGDGERLDDAKQLCLQVIGGLPRCMDMITAGEVIRRIELYLAGGSCRALRRTDLAAARRAVERSLTEPRFEATVNLGTVVGALADASRTAAGEPQPDMQGRGIVVLADGFDCSGVLKQVRALRQSGCLWPVECWSPLRCSRSLAASLRDLGGRWVCSGEADSGAPPTMADMRHRALATTAFGEVLLVESGAPLVPPAGDVFDRIAFREGGAVFPRWRRNGSRPGVWRLCGVPRPAHTAGLSGLVVDRARHWAALRLWRWISMHMYFFNGYVDGEGGAAQLAFARLGRPLRLAGR